MGKQIMKVRKYKKGDSHSYTLGITVTIELLKRKPELAEQIFLHSSFSQGEGYRQIQVLAQQHQIAIEYNDKAFSILSQKENCFAIGVFRTYFQRLAENKSHLLLVNPSNAGNMGTILRTAAGFGLEDVGIIRPAVDLFDPKAVRAAMGAVFSIRHIYFDTFEDYRHQYPKQHCYPFMLNSSTPLGEMQFQEPAVLIFGNEATGLPDTFGDCGSSVVIPHSSVIDSLNLPVAASIAMYEFTKARGKDRSV